MTYNPPGSGLAGAKERKVEASMRMKKPLTDVESNSRSIAEQQANLQRKKASAARNRAAFAAVHAAKKHDSDVPTPRINDEDERGLSMDIGEYADFVFDDLTDK